MQNDKTSIQISRKTRDMLKDLAVTESESYENIILRLIMLHKKEMKELLN